MGFLDWFTRSIPDPTPRTFAVQNPWAEHQFSPNIVIADVFGTDVAIVTRVQAMQVPAIAKARHLIASTIAAAKWEVFEGEDVAATQPTWLTQTTSTTPVALRSMWVADDLLFYGWSLLATRRDEAGTIQDAVRVPREHWDFDVHGNVVVNGQVAQADQVILIPGPFEGLLATGASLIQGALDIERAWQARVRNPAAVVELHNTDINEPLSQTEADAMVKAYNAKRRTVDGVTTYTPANVELRMHGEGGGDLFIAGRNAVAIDVARMTGLPAIMLDASQVAASLTYSTTEAGRLDLVDAIKNMWAAPIEARLSLDDVTPPGTYVAANFDNALTYRGAAQVVAPGSQTVEQIGGSSAQ